MSAVIEIVFDTKKDAQTFMRWLDNSGEQEYLEQHDVVEFEYNYEHLRIIAKS